MLTGIAIEIREPTGVGWCRMLPLADASSEPLHPFVTDHVGPGATVITDGWQGYSGLETLGYVHDRRSQRAARARRGLAPSTSLTSTVPMAVPSLIQCAHPTFASWDTSSNFPFSSTSPPDVPGSLRSSIRSDAQLEKNE